MGFFVELQRTFLLINRRFNFDFANETVFPFLWREFQQIKYSGTGLPPHICIFLKRICIFYMILFIAILDAKYKFRNIIGKVFTYINSPQVCDLVQDIYKFAIVL